MQVHPCGVQELFVDPLPEGAKREGALYPDGAGGKKEKEPPVLPPIEAGQEWVVLKVGVKEGETKPPPRYSESALLGAMETAGKLVEDEELRQQMKDSGLGTPATRAATIERLIRVGYVEREKTDVILRILP